MSGRGNNESMGCLIWFVCIVGVSVFLIVTMPVVFFVVALPLAIILMISFIKWLKK